MNTTLSYFSVEADKAIYSAARSVGFGYYESFDRSSADLSLFSFSRA